MPIVGKTYRHFKGNLYKIIALGKHSETLEQVVVYQAMYGDGDIWVRPINMWEDIAKTGEKRFTEV